MNAGDIAIMVFIAFVSAGMTALHSRHFSDLRQEISGLRTETGGEISGLRAEMRAEIAGLRTEMREEFQALRSEMHSDFASLRADLTQVALAVGVNRPRASGN